MGKLLIEGVSLKPLKQIVTSGGSVLRALKASEKEFNDFGEAYFSLVDFGMIRAWKNHTEMTSNIIVPIGKIKFVLLDDQKDKANQSFEEIILSRENYARLTIPPGIWFGFQGLAREENMLLNLTNLEHQPSEAKHKEIDEFDYDWSLD